MQAHTFENLIALCPTCHSRVTRGDIDNLAVQAYKANLGLMRSRYSEAERRLIEMTVVATEAARKQTGLIGARGLVQIPFESSRRFDFWNLLRDGLIVELKHDLVTNRIAETSGALDVGVSGPSVFLYSFTSAGQQLVARVQNGEPLGASAG